MDSFVLFGIICFSIVLLFITSEVIGHRHKQARTKKNAVSQYQDFLFNAALCRFDIAKNIRKTMMKALTDKEMGFDDAINARVGDNKILLASLRQDETYTSSLGRSPSKEELLSVLEGYDYPKEHDTLSHQRDYYNFLLHSPLHIVEAYCFYSTYYLNPPKEITLNTRNPNK